jgi:hypothetical protein
MDAREVFKMSMGKLLTDRLVRGINPEGVFDWLEYARVHWSVEINGTAGVISRVGKYVLLGQAMRKNTVYSDLLMRFAGGGKEQEGKEGQEGCCE